MRKSWLVLVAIFALVMFAVPAMAEVNLTGFVRVNSIASNFTRYEAGTVIPFKTDASGLEALNTTAAAPFQQRILEVNTLKSAGYLEQRGRLRFEAKGENVGAVAFFEIDMRWGDGAYAVNRNQGGGLEADSINLETKNVYIWFKPSENHTINVGVQGVTDAYRGVLFGGADFAAIVGAAKVEMVDVRYGYGKLKDAESTGNLVNKDQNNDVDLWILEGHLTPIPGSRVGLNLYFINDHAFPTVYNSAKVYTVGVDGSIKVGEPLTLSAFLFQQFGKVTVVGAGENPKFKGFSGDVRADLKAGPGSGFLEVLYVSGSDPKSDSNDIKSIVNLSNYTVQGSFYTSTDMEILFPNIMAINSAEALSLEPGNLGLGLLHVGAGFSMTLADKLTGKVGAGYSAFVKAGDSTDSFVGTGLPGDKQQGIEINARVTYALAKGLDLSGIGAYCMLGDAYKVTDADKAAGFSDPDDLYKLYARLNYAF